MTTVPQVSHLPCLGPAGYSIQKLRVFLRGQTISLGSPTRSRNMRTRAETQQLLNTMKTAEANMVWLMDHYGELTKTYNRRWVAVNRGKVMLSNPDRQKLLMQLRHDFPDSNAYAVQYVTDDPIDFIL